MLLNAGWKLYSFNIVIGILALYITLIIIGLRGSFILFCSAHINVFLFFFAFFFINYEYKQ